MRVMLRPGHYQQDLPGERVRKSRAGSMINAREPQGPLIGVLAQGGLLDETDLH